MRRLIFGGGYLGMRVAERWRDAGDRVSIVTRSESRCPQLERFGYFPIQADVTQGSTLSTLPKTDTVLFAVGYDRAATTTMTEVYAGGMHNVLRALRDTTVSFLYVSTTGVYGSADGGWVDERTVPHSEREGGRASLEAEQLLRASAFSKRSAILRMGGIYGPGRVPFLAKLRRGEPIEVPQNGWLNLIHVEDAAAILVAVDAWLAGREPLPAPELFCVTDGHPVSRTEYYCEVARCLGAPEPRFVTPEASTPAAVRARSDKRVSNQHLTETIPISFQYPTFREGLKAVLKR